MASEIKSESVQKPTVKPYVEVVKTGIKPSVASTEKSSDKETRLTADKPEVQADDHVVDWLHPLAECKFETLNKEVPLRPNSTICGPVLRNGDVYMIGVREMTLLKYSTSDTLWKVFDQTLSIPVERSALATYHSKLMLISEDRVWEFDDNDFTFKPSPNITVPLNWAYHSEIMAAASEGDYLLLIGKEDGERRASVLVFDSNAWVIRDSPYLLSGSALQVIVHNRSVYLIEWPVTVHFQRETTFTMNIYETSLQSLLDDECDPWQLLRSTLPSHFISVSNIAVIGGHLALISFDRIPHPHLRIWYYFTSSESWLETGCFNIPSHIKYTVSLAMQKKIVNLPDGSLMVMTSFDTEFGYMEPELTFYMLKPELAVYNPYDNLTVRAMIKLEMYANVPVLTKLEPQLSELSKRALFRPGVDEKYNVMYKHLFHDYGDDIKYGNEISKSVKYIYSWINQWQVGYGVVLPSWKNFCSILRAISPGSGKLADQIEAYFDQYSIKQIGRFSEDAVTTLASKLRIELASLCSYPIDIGVVKAGVQHCIEICDDLLEKERLHTFSAEVVSRLHPFQSSRFTTSAIHEVKRNLSGLSVLKEPVGIRTNMNLCIRLCNDVILKLREENAELKRSEPQLSKSSVHHYEGSLMERFIGYSPHLLYGSSTPLLHVPVKTGLSKEPSIELEVSQPKTKLGIEEEIGTEKITRSLSHLSVTSSGLSGVDVCGKTTITITNSSLDWHWEGFGLKLHVDNNTLPPSIEQCCLNISASLTGHYKFPKGDHLVSAIIWFRCEPLCKFVKLIKVELQHCACSHNTSNLNFVKAVCSQQDLPYVFKRVSKSSFSSHSSFGILEVNSFSGMGIVQNGSEERNYLANFLYQEERFRPCFQLYFVVTWNTVTHHHTAMNYFKDAKLYTKQLVMFDDQIEFQVSSNENWIIGPVNSKVVLKKHVDGFTPGETVWIPHSQFVAKFAGDTSASVPALECAVDMKGAKMPHNIVKLDISHTKGALSITQSDKEHGSTKPPTLRELMRALRSKAAFWEDIGVELQVDDGDLAQIRLDNAIDGRGRLREMLRKWLSRVDPRPSWTAIVEALEQIGDEELAGRLRSKYCTTTQ